MVKYSIPKQLLLHQQKLKSLKLKRYCTQDIRTILIPVQVEVLHTMSSELVYGPHGSNVRAQQDHASKEPARDRNTA